MSMKRRDIYDLLLYLLAVAALLSVAMCSRASSFEVEFGTDGEQLRMPTTITYRCDDPALKVVFLQQFEQWNAAASHIFTLVESDAPVCYIKSVTFIDNNKIYGETFTYRGVAYIGIGNSIPALVPIDSVMLHEIGHALGLAHANSVASIMYPAIQPFEAPALGQDDIDGIRFIYGLSPVQIAELQFKSIGKGRVRRFVTAGYSVSWDFGDGSPSVIGRRVKHRYKLAGTYSVTASYLGVSQSASVSVGRPSTGRAALLRSN